uniref:Uncharacterized protein n=1 Tax=Cacopsylla melanoneura TaxID=428564 RepID=A0A8D8U004_9HEMI
MINNIRIGNRRQWCSGSISRTQHISICVVSTDRLLTKYWSNLRWRSREERWIGRRWLVNTISREVARLTNWLGSKAGFQLLVIGTATVIGSVFLATVDAFAGLFSCFHTSTGLMLTRTLYTPRLQFAICPGVTIFLTIGAL